MATAAPTDTEIRSRLSAVLEGTTSLRDFYKWFVPATLELEYTGNVEAVRLVHDLTHFFSELSAGILTRAEIRETLERAASSPQSQPDRVIGDSDRTAASTRSRSGRVEVSAGWRAFEDYSREYFSDLWGLELRARSVAINDAVSRSFDLVSSDLSYVGDAKWLRDIKVPAAKWQAIAELLWLLQKISALKTFVVFGQDVEVAERFLHRFRSLVEPVEFYFLDDGGHRRL